MAGYIERAKREIYLKNAELRAVEENGNRYLTGLIPYNKQSDDMGFFEIIKPGAFSKSMQESRRIFALWNHEDSQVLGNKENGTLELTDTPAGLEARVKLNDTSYARDAWEQVQSGNVTTMSFRFSTILEDWDYDKKIRYLKEVRLYEVSFGVPFPAYAETQSIAELRALFSEGDMDEGKKGVIKDLLESILRSLEPAKVEEPAIDKQEEPKESEPPEPDTRNNLTLYLAKTTLYKEQTE